MHNRRPATVMLSLLGVAVVAFIGSGLLDVHRSWTDPRQATATALWIVFLLSVLGLVVTGVRLLVARRSAPAG